MPNHRIRLAGPWESQTLDEHLLPHGETVRCQLPVTLAKLQRETGIQLRRGFHQPTGIDDNTSLRIVIQASESPRTVLINDHVIAESALRIEGEFAFDVTSQVEEFNLLCVLFSIHNHDSPATLNTVWLEIQS